MDALWIPSPFGGFWTNPRGIDELKYADLAKAVRELEQLEAEMLGRNNLYRSQRLHDNIQRLMPW